MPGIEGCRNLMEYPAGGTILQCQGEDLVSVMCPNMRVVALRQRLTAIDPQLVGVPHDATSPLYQSGSTDRTSDNLFIPRVHWKIFLSHFKWVVASKGAGFFVRVVTDMTLLNVYLGKASVSSRLASQRTDDGELLVSNSLEDLLSSPDLVVVRVGLIVYYNKAAANVLQEALLVRIGLGKPTWIVEPDDRPFVPFSRELGTQSGMASCDQEVLGLVESTFERLELASGGPEPAPAYEEDGDEVTVGEIRVTDMVDEATYEPPPEPVFDATDPEVDPEYRRMTERTKKPFKSKPRRY